MAIANVRQYLPGTMDFFAAPASVPAAGDTYQAFLTRIANQLGSRAITAHLCRDDNRDRCQLSHRAPPLNE